MVAKKKRYKPKKPVRTFRDLIVYQRALQCSVIVSKKILPLLEEKEYPLREEMVVCGLSIPRGIARAHSARFDDEKSGLDFLDEAMKRHNEMVVYLEQVRDLYSEEVKKVTVKELIRRYSRNRRKVFHLYKAWERFLEKRSGE